MTLDHWDGSTFDWKKASASAFTTYNLALLVDFFNDLDNKNTQRNIIYVDQDSLFLPRSVLVDLEDNQDIATAYVKLMVDSAKTVRDSLRNGVSEDEIEAQAHAVLKFETQLAMVKLINDFQFSTSLSLFIMNSWQIIVPDENRRNSTRMYNPMSLAELQHWTDTVNTRTSQAKVYHLKITHR